MKWEDIPSAAVKGRFSDQACDGLKKSLGSGSITLLLGSGVSRCLVGDWAELLNEMAIIHCGGLKQENRTDISKIRAFIRQYTADSKFLPSGTSVLEQGEYLLFVPEDPEFLHYPHPEDATYWQEAYYAARIRDTMGILRSRNLRDGGGKNPRSLEEDFLSWLNDEPDPAALHISRRTLGDRQAILKKLETAASADLMNLLSNQYGETVSIDGVRAVLANEALSGEAKLRSLCDAFQLPEDTVKRAIREKVGGGAGVDSLLLNDNELNKRLEAIRGQIMNGYSDLLNRLVAEKAASLLKRPNYATLHAVLKLCLKYRIRHVVSYNFDTVFEELLVSQSIREALKETWNIKVQLRSYFQPQCVDLKGFYQGLPDENTVRVDHVHGVLHEDLEQVHPVFFSENSYRSYQDGGLHWSNQVLSQALRATDLFCVGFSGTDANFRYLIRLNKAMLRGLLSQDQQAHRVYLMESMEKLKKHYGAKGCAQTDDEKKLFCVCLEKALEMIESYYAHQFNAVYVWAQNYDDLANRLLNL